MIFLIRCVGSDDQFLSMSAPMRTSVPAQGLVVGRAVCVCVCFCVYAKLDRGSSGDTERKDF